MHKILKKYRKEIGATQTEMGAILKINQSHFGKIENGKVGVSKQVATRALRQLDLTRPEKKAITDYLADRS